MRVSVFTPSHNPRYLDDCYRSLTAQSYADWEWVVLLNGKAIGWTPPAEDPRVKVERSPRVKGVGAAKRAACELATGEVLVELDHDDRLTPNCLAEVLGAMTSDPRASLVYSDFAQMNDDGSPNDERFDEGAGWTYTVEQINGTGFLRCHAMAATPHNVGYIWYAPNHVRAFRRTAYEQVGGYDAERAVLDDHDLMIRLYEVGGFTHVDRCLYLQRMHGRNTQVDPSTNAFIQEQTVANYQEHIEQLALTWATRAGLGTVALRTHTTVGDLDVDERYRVLMFDPTHPRLPFGDNELGVIKATDILQRVPDRAAFLNECHRVLGHAGLLLTDTPSTDGRGAFQDPSHVAFYNENSFMYLTQAALRPTIPALHARLQVSHLTTYYPSAVHEQLSIPYVKANLLAVKDGPRQGGPLLC
jgi:glycosyltransferase involved in cell wall biosynthesis